MEEPTISIMVPGAAPVTATLGALRKAVRIFRGREQRQRDQGPQTDLEDFTGPNPVEGLAVDHLRSVVERVERLQGEQQELGADIKAIFAEAKSAGFVPRTVRDLLKIRRIGAEQYDQERALLDTYRHALEGA